MRNVFETYASFYKSRNNMLQALFITTDTLKMLKGGSVNNTIPIQQDGLVKIEDLIEHIKKTDPSLHYISRDHIVELFFKDRERRLLIINNDYIQYRSVTYVQPPSVLYFGTVKNLAERMSKSGLKSKTKGFIKLYSTVDGAKEFAKQFATREGDILVALEVDATKSFAEGTKFSTHKEGEYVVVKIEPHLIKGTIE